jgi:acetyl-CoA C-acetyltransferase
MIVAGARTPIGKLSGALGTVRAVELGGVAIAEALRRAGVEGGGVDYVVMGQVLMGGQGQGPARQAAVAGGIPFDVPATAINKVCLSGLEAIHLADLMIRAGEADVVVAGGMESMTQAPHLLPGSRAGFRYGHVEVLDAVLTDGLTDAFDHLQMGEITEQYAARAGLSRDRQDEIAALSHQRAAAAMKEGRLAEEIVPVSVARRRGDPLLVEVDEGVRPETTTSSLASLRPAFKSDGTITVGNASQISDGAAAVVVMSPAAVERLGSNPLAEIIGYGQVAGPDTSLLLQPSRAIRRALERAHLSESDVDLYEINEAFASVAAASISDLGVTDDVVNVNGGAIALGHPLGMSGARLVLSLAMELRRRSAEIGAVALCGGGGQGEAMLLKRI